MRNDCKGCTVRRVGCHANCSSYQAFCERNEAIKAARREDDSAKGILVAGYIKRAKAVRTKTHKMVWRYRGT